MCLMMSGPCSDKVPWDNGDFNLLRECVCTSLSINTCRLDWTHLESLAVNEREREVTGLYRPVIICLEEQPRSPSFIQSLNTACCGTHGAPLSPSSWSTDTLIWSSAGCKSYDDSQRLNLKTVKTRETITDTLVTEWKPAASENDNQV